ncbi:nitric oxide synthase 1-like [Artemia franciscana]|uniref:nitric oxide synthase 1-like n=1 Tax=Artemia franciscana TaxID=6661 RepID=UPI0032DA66A6
MELVSADASGRPHFTAYLSKYLQENVLPLKVTFKGVHPGSRDAGPCTIVIRLSWQHLGLNSPVSFEPGDLLGVLPENSNDMVSKLLKRLHLDSNFTSFVVQRLMIQKKTLTMEGPREEWVPYENLPPATIYEWFKKFLDITTPPTQLLLSEVSTYATNQTEKENLNLLSQDVGVYEQWKHSNRPTILSFLEAFPSLSIPPEAIISKIPLMKPRYYSVSSCLSMSLPTSVDLIVGVVKFTTEDGSSRNGLCSMYLNEAAVGTIVNAFFRRFVSVIFTVFYYKVSREGRFSSMKILQGLFLLE